MSIIIIYIQTQTYRKFIYCFFEIFYTRITHSTQIEIFWKVLLCLLNTSVYIIMSLLPIFKIQMNYCTMVQQIWTVGVQTITLLQFLQSLYQYLSPFNLILLFFTIVTLNQHHSNINVRFHFLRIHIFGCIKFIDSLAIILLPISQLNTFGKQSIIMGRKINLALIQFLIILNGFTILADFKISITQIFKQQTLNI